MQISLFRSLWGVKSSEWEIQFPRLKQSGINGIEASLADVGATVGATVGADSGERFVRLIKKFEMSWICGLYSGWIDYLGEPESKNVEEHLECLEQQLKSLLSLPIKPIHINIHAGSDSFSREESITFFKGAALLTATYLKSEIPFSYETHRGRILYSPWVALDLVKEFPDLRFTLDLSHWIIVTERLLTIEVLEHILARTSHIHARIGTRQSSQVSNPSSVDVIEERLYFESVWKAVLRYQQERSQKQSTLCLEYGPADEGGYQPKILCLKERAEYTTEFNLDDLIAQEAARLPKALQPI
jgi:sugar phosphate isomerase/epimerase